ncbi:MAG TPA: O-methyltransferase [Chloroflexota bacterium]|nr:O-methyltransferase [Chloroflexota bacterium]
MSDVTLTEYTNQLFGGEDALLQSMTAEAVEKGLPTIQVPPELGRLLAVLTMSTPHGRVLEIGALFGYSTVTIARALPSGGHLVTLELEPERAELVRSNLQRAGLADRATVIAGPALESLAQLEGRTFDLVFIDADKSSYPQYLEWSLKLTEPGSVIVADNVWRKGDVLHPAADDEGTRAIAAFNQAIAGNARLISAMFATRDGDDAASISVVRR